MTVIYIENNFVKFVLSKQSNHRSSFNFLNAKRSQSKTHANTFIRFIQS